LATLAQHKADCVRFLSSPYEEVHVWIDQYSNTNGAGHRKFLHHKEGVEQARRRFGDEGATAAAIHILRDCRNIPREVEYSTGAVDPLGLPREWPVAAYAKYTEEAFSALVENTIKGPIGIVLWAFFKTPLDLDNVLRSVTHCDDAQRADFVSRLPEAFHEAARLAPISVSDLTIRPFADSALEHSDAFINRPLGEALRNQFGSIQMGFVPIAELVNPLALIDYENIEQLRATLEGDDELAFVKFAFPTQLSAQAKILLDPNVRTATFISAKKVLTVTGVSLNEVPGAGMEVKFLVTGMPDFILVTQVAGRLYLRNGIHRAYLLASMGVRELPCIIIQEAQIPMVVGPYPTFSPSILVQPRPPLLIDTFNTDLSINVPLQRTQKVIRITAEELIIPVD
jgi:hypothetical protein